MNQYVTGTLIRRLREERDMTQQQLAEIMHVSGKAVSKWENGRGYPDISLIEPLSAALGVSVIELLSGESINNRNRSANMLKTRFYVCPVCGNVVRTVGEAAISCCGITLPAHEPETPDADHEIHVENVEDEYDESCEGYNLFTNFDAVERERTVQQTVLDIRQRYGKNAVLRGVNYLPEGTQRERNGFIGGHRAGYDDKRRKS